MPHTPLNPYDFANIFTEYTDSDGFAYYNLYNTLNIDSDIDPSFYTEHIYAEAEDFYSLSHRYYGDVRLWWIILAANQVINPFEDLKTGYPIKIPSSAVVSEILKQITLSK